MVKVLVLRPFCYLKGMLFLSVFMNLYEFDKDRIFIGVRRIKSSVFYESVLDFALKLFPSFKSMNESC